ncbi:hypothetical protein [Georgenia daeguensis]
MSIFTRKAEAAARAAKAQAAAEAAAADLAAIEAEETRKRRARLDEYDRATVDTWDAQRVSDELAEARARLTDAALATPFFAALIDYATERTDAADKARTVRDAARRLGIEDDVDLGTHLYGGGIADLQTVFSDVLADVVNRRRETTHAERTAARAAYVEDLD